MRIPRIYVDIPLYTSQTVIVPENASRHIIQVLRLRAGNKIVLFNGQGGEYKASLVETSKYQTTAHLLSFQQHTTTSPLHIELGLALIKSDKMDFALQKAVELGVATISPLNTDYSTVKFDDKRAGKKQEHWQGVIRHACEQSGRDELPQLNPPQALQTWIGNSKIQGITFEPRAEIIITDIEIANPVRILIGPEGGFSEKERTAIQQQLTMVRLGPRILRAETAVISALSILQLLQGDLAR